MIGHLISKEGHHVLLKKKRKIHFKAVEFSEFKFRSLFHWNRG
jgi:hypothetical protein